MRHAALQFALGHEAVSTAIVGACSAAEIDDCLDGARAPIPEALWGELKEAGVLPGGVPTPPPAGFPC